MSSPIGFLAGPRPARLDTIEGRLGGLGPSSGAAASFEALVAAARARQASTGGTAIINGPIAADPIAQGPGAAETLGSSFAALSAPSTIASQPAAGGRTLGSASGDAVIDAARAHLGVPYKWGGTDAEMGFDCSGLIQDAYRRVGVELPKWSRHQATMGVEVGSIDDALPGDIIAFGEPVDHVGLYVGDGQMLHAPRTGDVVKISDIVRPIVTIRRIVTPDAGAAAASAGGHRPSPSESTYAELFAEAGARWNVDPALLAAVAATESGFDPEAVSPVGAQGLMQFMPATAASMNVDPWDPSSAIDGAARYLRQSLDRFGATDLAIASYNAGPGAVARYDGIPPFPETQAYVRKVQAAWEARS